MKKYILLGLVSLFAGCATTHLKQTSVTENTEEDLDALDSTLNTAEYKAVIINTWLTDHNKK